MSRGELTKGQNIQLPDVRATCSAVRAVFCDIVTRAIFTRGKCWKL